MFGPGWIWGAITALALACVFVGFLGFLLLVINKGPRSVAGPLDEIWHRYEEGDITRGEFDRLRHEELERSRPRAGA